MAFQIVPEYAPTNPVGACVLCRVERRPGVRILDLGIDIDVTTDGEGQPVIMGSPAQVCETCVKEMAHMFGWITDDVSAKMDELRATIASQKTELRGLKDLNDAVRRLPVG